MKRGEVWTVGGWVGATAALAGKIAAGVGEPVMGNGLRNGPNYFGKGATTSRLLQTGMGLGLIRDCIAIMNEVVEPLGHVNRYLQQQPGHFQDLLSELELETMELARDPYNADDGYWRRVLALRLHIGEASVAAAHAAMLHCGARGYLKSHRVQRRLREASSGDGGAGGRRKGQREATVGSPEAPPRRRTPLVRWGQASEE